MVAYWNRLPKTAKIYQVTVAPYTNAANTQDADNAAGTNFTTANLQLINDWIRTCPAPLAGVIDFADMLMSARNSNRWKTGYTEDGIHPDTTEGVPGVQAQLEADAGLYAAMFGVETPNAPTFTVSGDTANVVTTTIQLRNPDGSKPTVAQSVRLWLSDTAGGALCVAAPDGGTAITTGTGVQELTAETHILAVTDATGKLVITGTHSAAKTAYWNLEWLGRVYSSTILTWSA
jgi:hypothetical protein